MGLEAPQLNSNIDPVFLAGSSPEIVPLPKTSPDLKLHPFTVWWAIIYSKVQYKLFILDSLIKWYLSVPAGFNNTSKGISYKFKSLDYK